MVLPGMLHISLVKAMTNDRCLVGAQNVSATKKGAFTGEVAAEQLADYGISWVLIGHSERRHVFNETNAVKCNFVLTYFRKLLPKLKNL